MVSVDAAAGCVTVRRRVDRWKISACFASTDTISDKKDNHGGRTDHGQQLRPQDADDTCQPASQSLWRGDSFSSVFFFPNMIRIYRISGTDSDSGTDSGVPMPVQTRIPRGGRGARGKRRALSGGLPRAGAPGKKRARRADEVLNAGPAGDDGFRGSVCSAEALCSALALHS